LVQIEDAPGRRGVRSSGGGPVPITIRRPMSTSELNPLAAVRLRSAPVVLATCALAAVVAAPQSSAAEAVLRAVLVLALVPCALIDIDRRIIPNRITGPGSLVAIALGLVLDPAGEPGRLLWAAIAGGFLLAAALVSPRGMGMGDVKLLGMMGLFLGRPVALALLLALLGSIVAGIVLSRRLGVAKARKTGLPFGPYLAVGGVIAALAGNEAQAPGRSADRAGNRGGGDHREWHRPARHREGEAPEGQGPGRRRRQAQRGHGKRIPLDVVEGDEVLYSKYGGTEIKVDGEELLVLRESDVLAKVQS
jgi:leader peptidase (prepilin peptidase)/N-methyltransferase